MSRTYFEINRYGSARIFSVNEVTFKAVDKASQAVGIILSDAHVKRLVSGEESVTIWNYTGRKGERVGYVANITKEVKAKQCKRIASKGKAWMMSLVMAGKFNATAYIRRMAVIEACLNK